MKYFFVIPILVLCLQNSHAQENSFQPKTKFEIDASIFMVLPPVFINDEIIFRYGLGKSWFKNKRGQTALRATAALHHRNSDSTPYNH